ncbi:pyruvate, phosphate dikinase [Candidatus Woesearchaeota archaeon]|jgi:pyruvate, orthophosphate dikinase|nr:pyruvate, phosphate dikinase [Candidatus Woesearchaeota archaeon]MBT4368655.1 pyruvate, phosphate dikinase [Candidatus Woesearchaeota archaeon]MBT4712210.1 pyruvate, phosphate dikinase [Candidatus Woesearchaeota archaeon]MBT6638958.1 pyruvate, phosphate dikinase [Candidatus Woesearchaeota archaeon]MBT7134140.1 pyruvate, phosphate dikinase [Candidatus Woesearchaeota archaeon]
MEKFVYAFEEGNKDMVEVLGGKGANLAEMTVLGVPVPPGFTITTAACDVFYKDGKKLNDSILAEIDERLVKLESVMGQKLGDDSDPLLVSVRSGAAASMPGMMDTVLNLGLNDISVEGLAKKTGNERFAWDSYRRFIQMFGDVVMGVPHHDFEEALESVKNTKGVEFDTDLDVNDLKEVVSKYKDAIQSAKGTSFPQNPKEQLIMSVEAVFGSWNNDRAIIYRRINNISSLVGTAVNIQTMVFGNMGETSGTGVCFSRNPSTGENKFYGEYLMNAQGEDVVAGIRTPKSIETLEEQNAEVYKQIVEIKDNLEKHYKDMQDMEFTIQEGKLYFLQTRAGKRTGPAAVKMAVDMVDETLISKEEAVLRVDPEALNQLLHKQLDPVAKTEHDALTKGLPASPGAAVGEIVFNAIEARDQVQEGKTVILVRTETSPEDIEGMNAAVGILTSRGGMTSHAAVVARGMGKCCVAGCGDAKINEKEKSLVIGDNSFTEGDFITLDGATGEVFEGKIPVVEPTLSGDFGRLMEWADEFRTMKIRTNADTPHDAETAIKFGAEGIGLCRTEHMFFEGERIKAIREMILSKNVEERKLALNKLLPFQKADFVGLFNVMKGKPVTIRLLDPPLHEFLPKEEEEIKEISTTLNVSVEELNKKIEDLHEVNPMLGHRGCRLGLTYPEITEMQSRAIFEAAKETGAVPEIMVPLVGDVEEFKNQKAIIVGVAKELGVEAYKIGTMIEVPRGALTADTIAKEAEFFSFGTNDLTQMTLGFSRDDVGKFIPEYVEKGVYERDPFQALDQEGVGQLIFIAVEKGRQTRPDIKLGICGEHGGEPSSVEFCNKVGLNYVSCSPFRVPIAKLAAAQAALKQK